MKKQSLTVVCVVSVLALGVGCAKKREEGPRGTVVGAVKFSAQVADRLSRELGVSSEGNCLQMVELSAEPKSTVVEMSVGKCDEGKLASSPIATMKILGDASDTTNAKTVYLMMGTSANLADNTPVATLTNVSVANDKTSTHEIGSLCSKAGRLELSRTCTIESQAGAISAIKIQPSLTLTALNLEMGLVNLENDEQIRKDNEALRASNKSLRMDMDQAIAEAAQIRESLGKVEAAMTDIEKRIGIEEGKGKGLLKTVEEIEKGIAAQNKSLDALQERSSKVNKAVTDQIKVQEGKLSALEKSPLFDAIAKKIAELEAKRTQLNQSVDELRERAMDRIFKAIEDKIRVVGENVGKLDADSKTKLDAIDQRLKDISKAIEAGTMTSTELRTALEKMRTEAEELLKKVKPAEAKPEAQPEAKAGEEQPKPESETIN